MDQYTIEEFDNYINDPEKFQILDNNYIVEEPESKRKPLTLEELQNIPIYSKPQSISNGAIIELLLSKEAQKYRF